MSTTTSIEWTDVVWNPVRGCSLVSAGCANCYAMKTAHRFSGPGKPYEGLTEIGPHGPRWNGMIRLVPEALDEPLHWKKPRRVFVNSMSDLFHEDVSEKFIDQVLGVVMLSPWHTYQVLTKRPERMAEYFSGNVQDRLRTMNLDAGMMPNHIKHMNRFSDWQERNDPETYGFVSHWPLKNLWLGVSVENQSTADERIPILLQTPAAVRWISAEPLLGPIDLTRLPIPGDALLQEYGTQHGFRFNALCRDEDTYMHSTKHHLDWTVLGGESGLGARPCDLGWIRSIKDQCQAAGVPVFVKQLGKEPRGLCEWKHHDEYPAEWLDDDGTLLSVSGAKTGDLCHAMDDGWWPCKPNIKDKKGGDISEFPNDLRVREFPS